MKKILHLVFIGLGAFLVSLPISFVVTIILFPFWSWIEERFGIEAVGHSGPAEWCFWVVSIVVFFSIVIVTYSLRKHV